MAQLAQVKLAKKVKAVALAGFPILTICVIPALLTVLNVR
jgi:hypothetical protein